MTLQAFRKTCIKKGVFQMSKEMPTLFKLEIEDKDETTAERFIYDLNQKDFIKLNEIYLTNYINADMKITFAHIKLSYKRYVIEGGWSEEKFEEILYVIAKRREMMVPKTFLKFGSLYDDGKLTKEIELERRKYENKIIVNDDEKELLEYIAKHGGR